jgi:hypothetical protein
MDISLYLHIGSISYYTSLCFSRQLFNFSWNCQVFYSYFLKNINTIDLSLLNIEVNLQAEGRGYLEAQEMILLQWRALIWGGGLG